MQRATLHYFFLVARRSLRCIQVFCRVNFSQSLPLRQNTTGSSKTNNNFSWYSLVSKPATPNKRCWWGPLNWETGLIGFLLKKVSKFSGTGTTGFMGLPILQGQPIGKVMVHSKICLNIIELCCCLELDPKVISYQEFIMHQRCSLTVNIAKGNPNQSNMYVCGTMWP